MRIRRLRWLMGCAHGSPWSWVSDGAPLEWMLQHGLVRRHEEERRWAPTEKGTESMRMAVEEHERHGTFRKTNAGRLFG